MTASNVVETVAEVEDNEKEVEVGDIDKDGDLDVLIVSARSFSWSGRRRAKLYINNNGVLQESSHLVTGDGSHNGFADYNIGRNGFFRDYDNDGWLDIILISDIIVGPPVGTTRYYANQHPNGVFTGFVDETASRMNGANGDACGGASADFDHDGDMDFYFGNYPGPSQDTMHFNNGSGNFTQASAQLVPLDGDYTVDVATGDINGDGKVDIMVCSDNDPAYIYYNDNQGAGSQTGDYRYTDSTTQFTIANSLYPAMEPGDFNRDGKMDIYFANRGPGERDAILVNLGNDPNTNKATFMEITMPGIVSDTPTAKVTVADLNADGRKDLIVMGGDTRFQSEPSRRPVIYRNTSVNGEVSFVEWSPATAFPTGETQSGWHAAAFDVDSNKTMDILVGGMNHDHLFMYAPTPTVKDSAIGAVLPDVHNNEPRAIIGTVTAAQPDNFSRSIPSGATVSAVLHSTADLMLEVRNSGGTVIASSDRGGKGIEEAFEFTAPGGDLEFRVSLLQPSATLGADFYQLEVLSRSN